MAPKRTRADVQREETIARQAALTADVSGVIPNDTLQSAVSAVLQCASQHERKMYERECRNTGVPVLEDAILPSEQHVWLLFTFKTPPKKEKLRPIAIPLKHSLFREAEEDVLFIVKEPQRAMKNLLASQGTGGVTRVLDISKIRKRYGTHEARRALLRSYDHFLADTRIAPMLPNLLGTAFVKAKRMPLPVNVRRDVVPNIRRALACTMFAPRGGTSCSVRVGRVGLSPEAVVDNVLAVLQGVLPRIEGGFANVQSVLLKSDKSPSLPLYVSLPTVVEHPQDTKSVVKADQKVRVPVAKTMAADIAAADVAVSVADERPAKRRRKNDGGVKKTIEKRSTKAGRSVHFSKDAKMAMVALAEEEKGESETAPAASAVESAAADAEAGGKKSKRAKKGGFIPAKSDAAPSVEDAGSKVLAKPIVKARGSAKGSKKSKAEVKTAAVSKTPADEGGEAASGRETRVAVADASVVSKKAKGSRMVGIKGDAKTERSAGKDGHVKKIRGGAEESVSEKVKVKGGRRSSRKKAGAV